MPQTIACPGPRTFGGCGPIPGGRRPIGQSEEGSWDDYGAYYPEAYDDGSGWDAKDGAYDAYADQWGYYDEPYEAEYGYEEAQGPENNTAQMTDENGIMYAFEYDESWFEEPDE